MVLFICLFCFSLCPAWLHLPTSRPSIYFEIFKVLLIVTQGPFVLRLNPAIETEPTLLQSQHMT